MDKEQKVRLTPSNGFLRERPVDLWSILYSNQLNYVLLYNSVLYFTLIQIAVKVQNIMLPEMFFEKY
jgi:hypothetical protein